MSKLAKCIASAVLATTLTTTARAEQTLKPVLLSEVWRVGSNGTVVIQVDRRSVLVVDNPRPGHDYRLKAGSRLIVRAAHVQLKDVVTISGASADAPPLQPDPKPIADTGPAGAHGDPGHGGGRGGNGKNGADGIQGVSGVDGNRIILDIGDVSGSGQLLIADQGGKGGQGQQGQAGGKGGQAGHGGKARSGVGCDASGGDAGPPGLGGAGGRGGPGGVGGQGGALKISAAVAKAARLDENTPPTAHGESGMVTIYYGGGLGGEPGTGGRGGPGGEGNDGGEGDGFCNGGHGVGKAPDTPDTTENLGSGPAGPKGTVVTLPH